MILWMLDILDMLHLCNLELNSNVVMASVKFFLKFDYDLWLLRLLETIIQSYIIIIFVILVFITYFGS